MAERAPFLRTGAFATVDRNLARRVLLGVALLGLMAISGPLLSYERDTAEVHRILHQRLVREGQVYAAALGSHFRMLEAELERLAARPEIDLADDTLDPERELLDATHQHSALFKAVALLDSRGQPVWSEPKHALENEVALAGRDWFQKVLALQRPVVNAVGPHSRTFVVAAPILRAGKNAGVLVGILEASGRLLPGGRAVSEGEDLIVVNRAGDVFVPEIPPLWTFGSSFLEQVDAVERTGFREGVVLDGKQRVMSVALVGQTGLRLVLVANEEEVLAPMRRSFLWQLLFLAVLQTLTVLLFSLYLRRTYRAFLVMDGRAVQQEKMAALGSASSLIAHEVKNSLNGLKAAASLLDPGPQSTDAANLPVRTMRGQIDRLGHLANSLLHFGKPANAQLVVAELNQVVRDTLESLASLPERDEVTLTADYRPPTHVRCDPLLLVTALDNLIRNAVEAAVAAKDVGKVIEPRVLVRVLASGQGASASASVMVEDNAGGPPPDFEAQLFEPFVTSKPKGIGLGLSMARQALEQQGGTLKFERTAQGSRFTVELSVNGPKESDG